FRDISCAIGVIGGRMATMRGGKGWWPWVVAGAAVTVLIILLVVTALPLGRREGLPTSANTAQLNEFLIAAGTAALAAVVWAWHTTRTAPVAPTINTLMQGKGVLASRVEEQWTDEALVRSLYDPLDSMPVQWQLTAHRELMGRPEHVAI